MGGTGRERHGRGKHIGRVGVGPGGAGKAVRPGRVRLRRGNPRVPGGDRGRAALRCSPRVRKNWITAGELMAKLEADPEFVAQREAREAEHARRVAELAAALTPLLDALREAGCSMSSASELTDPPFPKRAPWPAALPVLLAHLDRPYPSDAREVIAGALAVPEMKEVGWDALLRHYREEKTHLAKDALAAAIDAAADDQVIGDVIALARDTTLGPSRILLLSALTRSKDPRARTAITDLATDPDLVLEIRAILRRLARRKH
jgi:hypothetical protein